MWLFMDRMTLYIDLWMTSALIFVTLQMAESQEQYPILKASQCFKSRTIPKVVFGCPSTNHIIRIVRAFHGLRPRSSSSSSCSAASPNASDVPQQSDWTCSYCEGDCVDDTINEVYDWSSCIGVSSCSRTVLQSYIHSCPTRDKFSEYLHVEYQCIPKDNAINICAESKQMTPFGGYLTSPNYPLNYPTNQDCSCTLRADDLNVRMVLSFYDLFLETKNGRCRADWLMLLQEGEKHRHCGVITSSGSKNITTLNGLVTLQFHSNAQDQVIPATLTSPDVGDKSTGSFYKGFWIHYEAEDKRTTINLLCGALAPNDPALLEARSDSLDDDVIGTGGQGHRNDLITSSKDRGFTGHTTGKLFNGDVAQHESIGSQSPMTTERDVTRLDDGGDSKSTRRQPTQTSNDGEKKLSLASSSAISSISSTDSRVYCVLTLFIFYVTVSQVAAIL